MGLKDLLQSQKRVRELQSEVTSLQKQQEQAERRLQDSGEQVCHVKKEVERQEANRCDELEEQRLAVERELFSVLEPLLLNLPSARAAIAANPALLARDMIGMFQPVDDFIRALGLSAIGRVGEEEPFESARHDCPTVVKPGTPVRIVTIGYGRGEEIWIKARVKEL